MRNTTGKCAITRMVCPETSDPGRKWYCPWFWETIATDIATGKETLVRSCGAGQLQTYMIEVIKASNRPAAAVESMRNEMVNGVATLAAGVRLLAEVAPKPLLLEEKQND